MIQTLAVTRKGVAVLAAATLMLAGVSAQAVVLIDTDFTAADGYVDGLIQFQQPNGAGNGIWLGQKNDTTLNPSVDSTGDGTVNVISGSTPTGDAFLRNVWNLGATGATLGGGSPTNEVGNGFSLGDKIEFDFEVTYDLGDGTNRSLSAVGLTDCFATCGFNASPRAGVKTGYNSFEDGVIKVFSHQARNANAGTDNPFALFLPLADIGMDNGFTSGLTDYVSDKLMFSYSAEYTDETTNTWTATELVVTNVDSATEIVRGTVDNPAALETFVWNSTGVDDAFTDAFEQGVAAHPDNAGQDMFFAARWTDDTKALGSSSYGSARFEFTPVPGPPVPGDYNGDEVVNAADYTVWRDSDGQVGAGLPADGTGDDLAGIPDGDVDSFDYQFWAANYGASNASFASAVPEPTALALVSFGFLIAGARRR